jgi:cation:H+ antiporter
MASDPNPRCFVSLYHVVYRGPPHPMLKAIPLAALFLLAAAPALPEASPFTILWAAPSILIAAMVIAWAAESAQFFIAQGFALAILAWMQTLPEVAVEADLAWRRQLPSLFANLTGALRLLTGLGWPIIYAAAAVVKRRRGEAPLGRIQLTGEHSIQVVGLLLPILYAGFVVAKGSLGLVDSVVLAAIYAAYLAVLRKVPPQDQEGIDDLERIPRYIVTSPRGRRIALIAGLFMLGGVLISVCTDPFVGSLFSISLRLGIPSFVFIQWVAPFVSEFPEGLSTFYWARTVDRAPMALMNMVSSNINQWTLLVAMLPAVLSVSVGHIAPLPLDGQQKLEVLMTIGQQLVGMLFLTNMELAWWEAGTLFLLWLVQFGFSAIKPDLPFWGPAGEHVRFWITILYFVWAAWELVRMAVGRRRPLAFQEFAKTWRAHISPRGPEKG